MFSFSLANRTKAPLVAPPHAEGTRTRTGSHELPLEGVYTSQAGLAFYTPPDTDAFQYALSPEPIICEEKQQEDPTTIDAMVVSRRKTSSKSSSVGNHPTNPNAPPPPQAKKKKVHPGLQPSGPHRLHDLCPSWHVYRIRHKKCDEAKPTCRRCAAANVVCDGYQSAQPPSSKSAPDAGAASTTSQAVAKSTATSSYSSSSGSPASSSSHRSLSPSSRRSSASTAPLFTINPIVFESATEARYFHHFRVCTRFGLAESAGLLDFWDAYALPIAHQEDYLRQTISAVGAAHQLFVIRSYTASSSSSSWDTDQENAAMQQYNRAISSLVKAMSSPNSVASSHGALLCCLMFVTFESLLGRYSESIKHIQSGFQLLASLDAGGKIRDAGLWQQTYDMFARLGLEFSAFMDAPLTPALPSNSDPAALVAEEAQQPFADLNEAMYSLRTLDIGHFLALHEAEQRHLMIYGSPPHSRPPTPEGKMARADPYAAGLPRGTSRSPVSSSSFVSNNNTITTTTTFGPLWEEAWNDRFYAWNRRFELTAQRLPPESDMPERDRGMLARLRLQQSFWEMAVELSKNGGDAAGVSHQTCEECLERAERLAAPFLAANKPTFSLDGDLISDLSFIISVCRDPRQQERALKLLRSLNRREGIWDSREIAEMHEFSISLGVAELWGQDEGLGCSVPAFMRSLSRMSEQAYTPRAALVSMAEFESRENSNSSSAITSNSGSSPRVSSVGDGGEGVYVV
ncbi:hypothetical protein PG997_001571 [Apiospora hydei]|uniref:Zn(2)-C6 fungal-type domain-containing protein n=1 Tax=Apiospora hydei TaxID=1337664 RepID=A0ABR1XDY4_9PEZI